MNGMRGLNMQNAKFILLGVATLVVFGILAFFTITFLLIAACVVIPIAAIYWYLNKDKKIYRMHQDRDYDGTTIDLDFEDYESETDIDSTDSCKMPLALPKPSAVRDNASSHKDSMSC